MTFMTDRMSPTGGRQTRFGSLLGRLAIWLDRAGSQRTAGAKAIEVDKAPERVLRDIGLLDGRQVISLWREESASERRR